ncbi:MAG: penicillin-binding protein 1A [Bacillota bacterium]|nr:penicillin-binding protein 1A [Bacillota bacterium]MDW7684343.1 penicillin-binding protein 1A [Bacillota bacterium]
MRRLTRIAIILFLLGLLATVGAVGFLAVTVAGMEDVPDIETPLTSTFYDRNNEVITTRFEQNRFEVALEDVPTDLVDAFIAVEDHRFYEHHGIDLQGLMRAVIRNLRERRLAEGGSTITQQLARNLFLTHDKTFARKAQEMLLTVQLERKFSKDEILEKYLNTIYFGHSAYGVEAAARTYFGKSVGDLTLGEATILAGIPRGPAYYSPYLNMEAALNRRNVVLARMVDEGHITPAEKEQAAAEELTLQDRGSAQAAQQTGIYFINHLINDELVALFPDNPDIAFRGGLHVYTTLDKAMQQKAEAVVTNEDLLPQALTTEAGETVPLEVALVALDPLDGSVRALVGGRDFADSQINMALKKRSPGSAFKPFTFAAALQAGLTPAAVRVSEPVTFEERGQEPYEPTEYGANFYGPLIMRNALARSSNIVSVKLHDEIGRDKTVDMAKTLGIKSSLRENLSLPLGTSEVTPLEMAAAYAPFANQGMRVEPRFITRITDSSGRVLYQSEPLRNLVLDARIAYQMTDMMKTVMETGTGRNLNIGRPVAGKTGTSQDHRDSYMVGYTPDLVSAVWIGNLDYQSMGSGQTGSVRAGRVWAEFMRTALAGQPAQDFERPAGLTAVNICPYTGLLHNPDCDLEPVRELFIAGTEPKEQCSWPECPHCPPEPRWNWDGWWFRPRGNSDRVPPGQQEREAEPGNNDDSWWQEWEEEDSEPVEQTQ